MAEDMKRKIWGCKIGEVATARLPSGADFPMRQAVTAAYVELTGERPHFLFSGWGGSLDEGERAVVEKREPSPAFYASWLRQKHADELYEVVAELIEARDCQPGYVREHTLMKARAALAKCSPQAAQPEGKVMAHHYKRIDRCDRCERSQTNDVTPAQVRADGAIDMPTVTFDTKPTAPFHLREVVGTLCDKCAESFKAWWGEHGARLNGPAEDE